MDATEVIACVWGAFDHMTPHLNHHTLSVTPIGVDGASAT